MAAGQKIVYVSIATTTSRSARSALSGLHDGLREIVEGLQAEDQIIVTGLQQVRAGRKVAPEVIDMPRAMAKPAVNNPKVAVNR